MGLAPSSRFPFWAAMVLWAAIGVLAAWLTDDQLWGGPSPFFPVHCVSNVAGTSLGLAILGWNRRRMLAGACGLLLSFAAQAAGMVVFLIMGLSC